MEKISVGGQAVIEGVMMRAPNALAIAVRKPNGEVAVKEDVWRSLSNRLKFLKWPLIRGSIVFLEALINGFQALSFSANQALEEEKGEGKEEKKLSSLGARPDHVGGFRDRDSIFCGSAALSYRLPGTIFWPGPGSGESPFSPHRWVD